MRSLSVGKCIPSIATSLKSSVIENGYKSNRIARRPARIPRILERRLTARFRTRGLPFARGTKENPTDSCRPLGRNIGCSIQQSLTPNADLKTPARLVMAARVATQEKEREGNPRQRTARQCHPLSTRGDNVLGTHTAVGIHWHPHGTRGRPRRKEIEMLEPGSSA